MALTDSQRKLIEARLREEREGVLAILRRYDEDRATTPTDASGDLSHFPFHPADHGTDSYEEDMGTVFAERASRELEEIDRALHQLYEDPEHFGICENTGQPIPFERLEVIPWARTCVGEEDF